MIPSTDLLDADFTIEQEPSLNYKMCQNEEKVQGYCDEMEAVKQSIFKILNTERYKYVMYSWDYGVELADLLGEPVSYVCPEIERRITEALVMDDRIASVDSFLFDTSKKGVVQCSFTVHTIFGDADTEKVVNY